MPPNLRSTTRECVHLVTRGHFRSRDKDGGHTIRSAVPENPVLHTNSTALCLNGSYCRSKLYIAGIWIFDLLGFCYLDLDPMTFIYELDPYIVEINHVCKYKLPMSRLSIVIVWQTYRQTGLKFQIIYHTALRVVNDNNNGKVNIKMAIEMVQGGL